MDFCFKSAWIRPFIMDCAFPKKWPPGESNHARTHGRQDFCVCRIRKAGPLGLAIHILYNYIIIYKIIIIQLYMIVYVYCSLSIGDRWIGPATHDSYLM